MGVSCCGQAKDQPGVTNSKYFGAGPGIIDTQPVPFQQGLDYNFQQPTVQTPPNAHHSTFSNGFRTQSEQQTVVPGTGYNGQPPVREFGASSPSQQPVYGQPPMRESSPFQQTTLPTFTGTTFSGSNFSSMNHSITRPASSHSPHSPPPQVNASIHDEGKMSISIDFGVYPHVPLLHSLMLVQVQHSPVL